MQNKTQGGGWIKTDKNGQKYMSCNIEVNGQKVYFSMFKNGFKESEKHPDYVIRISDFQGVGNANVQNVNNVFTSPDGEIPF